MSFCDLIALFLPLYLTSAIFLIASMWASKFSKSDSYIFSEKPFTMDLKIHENLLQNSDKFTCNYERLFYNTTKRVQQPLLFYAYS